MGRNSLILRALHCLQYILEENLGAVKKESSEYSRLFDRKHSIEDFTNQINVRIAPIGVNEDIKNVNLYIKLEYWPSLHQKLSIEDMVCKFAVLMVVTITKATVL